MTHRTFQDLLAWLGELLSAAEAHVPAILARLPEDEVHDLIGGAAGALAVLLALHRHRPTAAVLDAARALRRKAPRARGGSKPRPRSRPRRKG